jgi:hypothetical protein
MTIGEFIRRVLAIKDPDAASAFFNETLAQLRVDYPGTPDPEAVVRSNIGWCFGEGMTIPCRKMWTAVCGAEHPVFGKMERSPTPEEALRAGMELGKGHLAERRPTAWQHLMKDD